MARVNSRQYNGNKINKTSWASSPADVLASIEGSFSHANALDTNSGKLREAQVGALHAILSHWTVDPNKVATVVMPTGTGKTETMLAAFCIERPAHLLVLVPSAALR